MLGALGIGALALVMVLLGRFALTRQHRAGEQQGMAEALQDVAAAEQARIQAGLKGAQEAASAATELTDAQAVELATRAPKRK